MNFKTAPGSVLGKVGWGSEGWRAFLGYGRETGSVRDCPGLAVRGTAAEGVGAGHGGLRGPGVGSAPPALQLPQASLDDTRAAALAALPHALAIGN